MWTLIRSFEGLLQCPGLDLDTGGQHNWVVAIWKWLDTPRLEWQMPDEGTRQAALFVLNLWGKDKRPWPLFCVFTALGAWDDTHTAAFQRWAAKPWRP